MFRILLRCNFSPRVPWWNRQTFFERSHSEHQSAHFKLNLAITEWSVLTQKSPAPLLEWFCFHVVLSRVLLWLNALVITAWRSYLELPAPCAAALRTVCTLDAKFRAPLNVLTLLKLLHVSDRVLDFYKEGSWGGAKAGSVSYFGVSRRWVWFTCGLLVCMWRGISGLTVDITGMRPQKKIIHLHPLCAIFCTFCQKHAMCTFIKPNTQTNIAPPDLA